MSDILKFSSSDLKGWLESETSTIFIPVNAKAQKLRDEMDNALENLTDAIKMLLDSSGKEIEKRNMKTYGRARALNKLARLFLDRMGKLKVPDQISYDSLSQFAEETQKAFLVTEVDIRNWFPKISPFFILDRRKFLAVYEKSKETLKVLNDFVTKEYIKTKTLEETFNLLNRLQTLEKQALELKEQKVAIESEKTLIESEIVEMQQKAAYLKRESALNELDKIDIEVQTLSTEVKNCLQHLQKPFIKTQALALHGGGAGLTQDEVKKLGQYLENPFEALATEETGCPLLKQILQKLSRLMAEGKLKLKPEKARKAELALGSMLTTDSLGKLHKKCVAVMAARNQLTASTEMEEARRNFSRLNQEIEKLGIRRSNIESQEITIDKTYNETLEKIQNHKGEIEKNILSFVGRKVQIA
ncbi:MAG: hypothetical protein ACUVUE_02680 [Candidatus Bathycorpusculaceae bacterium]